MDVEVVTSAPPRWLGQQLGSPLSVVRLPASCRWLAVLGARAAVVWIVEAFFFLEGLGIEGGASPGTVFISGGVLTCAWWAESAGPCRC